ncbi:sigma-70 family RNA polymerase sigma factor [Sphingobium fluviale]|uniref:sigma-70 family RNA polymerase sigma factor n=1 Tax=Sphingobium fluviale TaxID=2506423 RepID=UPI0015F2C12A|nr:sigma-70 family RNA polymerase sigma factor [Sphingobium fluviale]
MSKATELLEAAVAEVIANRPAEGERQTARQRIMADRAFATVLRIIAPRIRHFIKQYGLTAHWDDAEQVCAIGVHRAIEAYDPDKAMFTTFVNWQLRGELQGLRFRLMDDQRPSAKKVEATTISLHAMERGADGEDMPLESMIEDEYAEERTEAAAADHLAEQTCAALMDEYVRHLRSVGIAQLKRKTAAARPLATRRERSSALPVYVQSRTARIDPEELRKLDERIARDCDIVRRHLFGQGEDIREDTELGLTRERIRQITRRAARLMSELAAGNTRFAMHGEEETPTMLPRASHELGHSAPVRVTEPELEPLDSPPVPALALASAVRH